LSTYANVTVLGAGHDGIVTALGDAAAFLSETSPEGVTVVFAAADEEAHLFGEGATARHLAAVLDCRALEVSVYEDDILQYRLFAGDAEAAVGVVATDVALEMAEAAGGSLPEPDAGALVAALGRGDAGAARRLLSADTEFLFESERHVALAEVLGLPMFAAGWGYNRLVRQPEEFPGGPLTEVGELPEPAEFPDVEEF
jgi:hypothetical protein